MRIEGSSVNLTYRAEDGSMIEVPATAGTVAADLKKLDEGLMVRLNIYDVKPGYCIFHVNHPGCPRNRKDEKTGKDLPDGSQYLVRKWPAWENSFGTWEGLDQRAVTRMLQIGHSTYDYAAELERASLKREEALRKERSERVQEVAEQAAHAVRKDLGTRYRGRAFISKDLPKETGNAS